MRTRTVGVAAVLAVGVCVVAGGCRKDNGDAEARERSDRTAQAEGRLTVDQSAVLPVDVRAGVLREYPGATVQNVQKKTYEDRVVRYEVELTTKDGRKVTREFTGDGKPSGGATTAQ